MLDAGTFEGTLGAMPLPGNRAKLADHPSGSFTVDELRMLLGNAPADLPMFAIGAFAGLRVSELAELEW